MDRTGVGNSFRLSYVATSGSTYCTISWGGVWVRLVSGRSLDGRLTSRGDHLCLGRSGIFLGRLLGLTGGCGDSTSRVAVALRVDSVICAREVFFRCPPRDHAGLVQVKR